MSMMRNNMDISSKRIRQTEQEQEQQEQEKREHQYNGEDYNYYNNYPARARACAREADAQTQDGELPPREIMEQIAESYRANISPMITRAAAGIIERALKNGMEPQNVILAIEETGMASRPSPYYLSAVLRNWAEFGVVTSKAHGKWTTTEARPWWM